MEITTIQPFLEYYGRVRQRTNRVVELIPRDKFDWSYKPGKFSFADMIRHIAAIERYMFAENAQGKPSRYNGCGKELADGYDEVLAFFNRTHRESMEIFANLSDADLQAKCKTPAGAEITVWKWLRSMTEHEIHHRGELYLYLNLLDIKTPQIYGLSAEEVAALAAK